MSIIMRHVGTFVIKNTGRVPRCFLTRCAGMLPRQEAALRKKERVRRTAPAASLQPGGKPGMMKATKPERRNGQGRTAPRKRLLGFPASQTAMKIEHAALYVRDLEAAKEFFTRWFGAQAGAEYHNRTTDFRSYFLTFEGGARLEIMTRPGLADRAGAPAVGFAHLAFSVGSKEDVDDLTARLKAAGYEVVSGPRTTGDGYYESCVAGPEGALVEITV